jgi:hypothetical protein
MVTSTELVVGKRIFALREISAARGVRRRGLIPLGWFSRFALVLTTPQGDAEVLRHRNGFVVFQLAKAIEAACRESKRGVPETA